MFQTPYCTLEVQGDWITEAKGQRWARIWYTLNTKQFRMAEILEVRRLELGVGGSIINCECRNAIKLWRATRALYKILGLCEKNNVIRSSLRNWLQRGEWVRSGRGWRQGGTGEAGTGERKWWSGLGCW